MSMHASPPDAADGSPAFRLLIADDDGFVRKALTAVLATEFEIVGTAADADEAISLAEEHRPDAAIVDVEMPGGGGLRATREIRLRSPATAIVVLSGDESEAVVRTIITAGAMTYVRKGAGRAELSDAVRSSIAAARQAT